MKVSWQVTGIRQDPWANHFRDELDGGAFKANMKVIWELLPLFALIHLFIGWLRKAATLHIYAR
jgi:hypothetical protein